MRLDEEEPTMKWADGVERRIRSRALPDREPFMRRFLSALVDLGCRPEVPHAQRHDYLNVAPPPGHGRGRVCSVHATTSRVEFQGQTHVIATEVGLGGTVDRLAAGEKAALTLRSDSDVEVAVTLAKAVLAARRATS
jgi:hypothetical protein